jgi:peptidoglycan/LPS O-acetylase OafA/YrhL
MIYALFMLVVCFIAGWVSWKLYEAPFLRLKRHFTYAAGDKGEIASPLRVPLAGRAGS